MSFSAGSALSGAAGGASAGAAFGPWGAAIGGAAGGLLGGFAGGGSKGSSGHSQEYYNALEQAQWERNYNAQKEFAQQGIRWRVDDAKAAGLHPIFGLGGFGASFTPSGGQIIAGDSGGGSSGGGYDVGSSLESLGQSFGRAMSAKQTEQERAAAKIKQEHMESLQAENMMLQNDSLRADIALQQAKTSAMAVSTQQQVPAMPSLRTRADGAIIPGQANATSSSLFTVQPAEITANTPGRPGTEAGTIPDLGFARTNDGGYAPVYSNDVKQRLEEDLVGEISWSLRNRVPALVNSAASAPPSEYLRPGERWNFNMLQGAWYPVSGSTIGERLYKYLGTKTRVPEYIGF